MKIYVMAGKDSTHLAEKLLIEKADVQITVRKTYQQSAAMQRIAARKNIDSADVILVLINKEFLRTEELKRELDFAIKSQKNRTELRIIPVLFGDIQAPVSIEKIIYFSCQSEDSQYMNDIQKDIMHIITCAIDTNCTKEVWTKNYRNKKRHWLIDAPDLISMLSVLVVTVVIFLSISKTSNIVPDISYAISIIGLVCTVTALAMSLTYWFRGINRKNREENSDEIESYSKRLKQAIVPPENDLEEKEANTEREELDALGRMLINLEDIKEFYTWSQKQAKEAFRLAVAMCIVGFIFMAVAIILPLVLETGIQASLIPAVGGIITELIAGTALVVYKHSLAQLNHYHKALHEDERFLSSVNLIGKFNTDEARDEMLREIIRSEIQMNLCGIEIEKESPTVNKLDR